MGGIAEEQNDRNPYFELLYDTGCNDLARTLALVHQEEDWQLLNRFLKQLDQATITLTQQDTTRQWCISLGYGFEDANKHDHHMGLVPTG
eukprot:1471351-Ditylum_brightwellii.AAC.1